MPELERIHVTAGSGPLCTALERDGACVVEDAVSTEHLAGPLLRYEDNSPFRSAEERAPSDFTATRKRGRTYLNQARNSRWKPSSQSPSSPSTMAPHASFLAHTDGSPGCMDDRPSRHRRGGLT